MAKTLVLPRKQALCALLRQTASNFLEATQAPNSTSRRETIRLNNETICLLTSWEEGDIDPVAVFTNATPEPEPEPDASPEKCLVAEENEPAALAG